MTDPEQPSPGERDRVAVLRLGGGIEREHTSPDAAPTNDRSGCEGEPAVKECQNCGSLVTPDFARVFGNQNDEVLACLDCAPVTDIYEGRAAMTNLEI